MSSKIVQIRPKSSGELEEMEPAPTDMSSMSVANELATLTKREKDVLRLIVQGRSAKEAAVDLAVSKRTIEVHRYNAMKKLRAKNAAQIAFRYASQLLASN